MKKDMIVTVEKPEFRDRDAFRVVGLSAKCSFEDTSAIPALWTDFNAQESAASMAGSVGKLHDWGVTELAEDGL